MDQGIRKILKTRPVDDANHDEQSSMDVDAVPPQPEAPATETTTSAMDVVQEPAQPAPTGHTVGEAAEPSSTPPTAEELRLMRLRRFGAAPSTSESPKSETGGATGAPGTPKTGSSTPISISVSPAVTTSGSPTNTGSASSGSHLSSLNSRLVPPATPFNTPSATPTEHSMISSSPVSTTPGKSPTSISTKVTGAHTPSAQPIDYNTWLHRTICQVFHAKTLSPVSGPIHSSTSFGSEPSDNPSKYHVFDMQFVLDDHASQGNSSSSMELSTPSSSAPSATQFNLDDIDMIVMQILSTPESALPAKFKIFDYLAHCLSRLDVVRRAHNNPAQATDPSGSHPLVEMANRIYGFFSLVSLSAPLFAAISDSLVANPEYVSEQYVRVLGSDKLSKEHLIGITNAIGDSHLAIVFEPVFMRCAALARKHSAQVQFDSKSQRPIKAFRQLVTAGKAMVDVLVHHPRWTVKVGGTGRDVDLTLVGCLLSYTPLFALMRVDTMGTLTATLPAATLGDMILDVIKSAKEPALDWLSMALLKNKDALKMGAAESLSSTGSANSLATALLKIAKPFMDRSATDKNRYANFDANFLIRSHRLGGFFDSSDTHIVADKQTFEEWRSTFTVGNMARLDDSQMEESDVSALAAYQPTFITESFHMTLLAMILQSRTYRIYADVFERHAETKRLEMNAGAQGQAESLGRIKSVLEDVIFAPSHFPEAFLFWEMVGIWLARVASTPDGTPLSGAPRFEPPRLPLPATPPKAYQCLPEVIIEYYANFFMFAALYWEKFADQVHTDVMNSIVTLLASPQYVKNPHIRVKMVQVLTVLMPRGKGGRLHPTLVSPFDSNFVVENLGVALTNLYVDVERTGSASQFYDRLNARHELSSILVFLWSDRPGHKEAIVKFWQAHPETFKSFVDKLLNDSIFLLDEGRSKLLESHAAFQKLESGSSITGAERKELKETADRAARQTRSYMVLLRESLKIFSMVAVPHASLFMQANMHERLATSLNYCLYQIHGPKRHELATADAAKYDFDPAWIIDKLCTSILAFASAEPAFVEQIAKDTRSYSAELYANAATYLSVYPANDSQFMPKAWDAMSERIKQCTQHAEELEEELGDIPDDFLDPLMSTLMTDPVILPSSRITIDRATIERALLADPIDPYNRSPLTVEQLIPDTELKAKIDAFIAERRRK